MQRGDQQAAALAQQPPRDAPDREQRGHRREHRDAAVHQVQQRRVGFELGEQPAPSRPAWLQDVGQSSGRVGRAEDVVAGRAPQHEDARGAGRRAAARRSRAATGSGPRRAAREHGGAPCPPRPAGGSGSRARGRAGRDRSRGGDAQQASRRAARGAAATSSRWRIRQVPPPHGAAIAGRRRHP